MTAVIGIARNKRLTFEGIFIFSLRGVVVYTSVERIHFSPLRVDGSRSRAGHCYLGREGYGQQAQLTASKTDRRKAVRATPYQNRINTVGVEPSKDVGRAKADAPSG
jgi:hypothetical protein